MIRAILALVCFLGFMVSGYISVWGKPYDFALVTHVPWYGWLLLAVGLALYIHESWSTTKRKSR